MTEVGEPHFQLRIDYGSEWYLIVTSRGYHFYFNRTWQRSYWSIYDVSAVIGADEKDRFVQGINFDEVGVLMAKANGLKGFDNGVFVKQQPDVKQKEQEQEQEEQEKQEKQEEHEEQEQEHEEHEDEQKELIRDILQQEGFNVPSETPSEPDAKVPSTSGSGLNLGYSSSEEESDDEAESKSDDADEPVDPEPNALDVPPSNEEENLNHNSLSDDDENLNQGLDLSLSNDEEDLNQGLDLSLSNDEEDLNEGLDRSLQNDDNAPRQQFLELLNTFQHKISPYDPWFIVHDELVSELAQFPAYYAVDADTREQVFDQWVKQQTEPTPKPHSAKYPTVTQSYYKLLQDHKNDVKSSIYPNFKQQHHQLLHEFMHDFDVSSKFCEDKFRLLKLTLADHSKWERQVKAQKVYAKEVNLKLQKLRNFLSEHQSSPTNVVLEPDLDDFSKWIAICNSAQLSQELADSPINFVVGDEKRLQCYCEKFLS